MLNDVKVGYSLLVKGMEKFVYRKQNTSADSAWSGCNAMFWNRIAESITRKMVWHSRVTSKHFVPHAINMVLDVDVDTWHIYFWSGIFPVGVWFGNSDCLIEVYSVLLLSTWRSEWSVLKLNTYKLIVMSYLFSLTYLFRCLIYS